MKVVRGKHNKKKNSSIELLLGCEAGIIELKFGRMISAERETWKRLTKHRYTS